MAEFWRGGPNRVPGTGKRVSDLYERDDWLGEDWFEPGDGAIRKPRLEPRPCQHISGCLGQVTDVGGEWWKGLCNWPKSSWCNRCHQEIWDRFMMPDLNRSGGICVNGCEWHRCIQVPIKPKRKPMRKFDFSQEA